MSEKCKIICLINVTNTECLSISNWSKHIPLGLSVAMMKSDMELFVHDLPACLNTPDPYANARDRDFGRESRTLEK